MPTYPNFLQFLRQWVTPETVEPSRRLTDITLPMSEADRMPPAWTPQLERLIEQEALAAGIDPQMADRLVRIESQYNPLARSRRGAIGLTQLMPITIKEMGVVDPTDPVQNLRGGFGYLKKLIDRYDGDVEKALMAYNWGPRNIANAITPPPAVRAYARSIAYHQ